MKVWSRIQIKDKNKDINTISNSLVNYIYKDNPINYLYHKYNINEKEKIAVERYIANRVAGLLLLYFSKDTQRINDIVNKYNINSQKEVIPELEGYIEK